MIRQHFLLPNTLWGRFVLWLLQRYLNRATYEVRVLGRGPIRAKLLAYDEARWERGRRRTVAELQRTLDGPPLAHPPGLIDFAAIQRRRDAAAAAVYVRPRRLSLGYSSIPRSCARRLGVYLNVRNPNPERQT